MTDLPKLSVIVPVYNRESFLPSLFEQIQKQSLTDFECIIVDDGSTDRSGEICDGFAESDDRFSVFHTENGGVSKARNIGLRKAGGKYITFVDSDDGLHPDYLKNLLDCIEKSGADMVIGTYMNIDAFSGKKSDAERLKTGFYTFESIVDTFAFDQETTGVYGYCWSKLFRRELICAIEFDEELRLLEDFDFNMKIYKKIKSVYFDNKPYYYYFHGADNSSENVSDNRIDYLSQLKIYLRYKDFLQSEGGYRGENEEIIERRIGDYIFFTLFHSPLDSLKEHFEAAKKIVGGEKYSVCGSRLKGLVMKLFEKDRLHILKAMLSVYRLAAKIAALLRGGRKSK